MGNWFQGLSGGPPGMQAAIDHERVESMFSQQVRHPGAGRFARSSTVEINLFVPGQMLYFFGQIVGFNPD